MQLSCKFCQLKQSQTPAFCKRDSYRKQSSNNQATQEPMPRNANCYTSLLTFWDSNMWLHLTSMILNPLNSQIKSTCERLCEQTRFSEKY